MSLYEGLRGAFQSLRANKLRAALTMLGIIVGIAAVIAVVTIGSGGKAAIQQEMQKSGVNLFVLYSKNGSQGGEPDGLTRQDAEALKRALPQVKYMLPASTQYAGMEVNQRRENVVVVGTTTEFADLRNREIAIGRFFSQEEYDADRRVVVIDDKSGQSLFGAGNPIGQQVMIGNVSCRVIGVLGPDKSTFAQFNMGPKNSYVYIPWGTWADIFQSQRVDQLEGATYQESDLELTISSAKRILNQRHGTDDQYDAFNVQQLVQSAGEITKILTIIIGLAAGISLLVGGIGIMNIMLVSVTERTREIGLRKALGARERDIMLQFLLESTLLALTGGILGILLGVGSAMLAAYFLNWPSLISAWSVILAVSFSVAVGLFFGYYPAWKAAKLEPIVALRHE